MQNIKKFLRKVLFNIYTFTNNLLLKAKIPFFFRSKIMVSVYYFLILLIAFSIIIPKDDISDIPVFEIKKSNFLVSLTESGELKAKRSNMILAPRIRTELKITYIIPEGTNVEAGDVVLKFDPSEALNRLRDAQAQYELALSDKEKLLANQLSAEAQSESSLKSAQLSLELSKLQLQQMKFEAPAEQQKSRLQFMKDSLSYNQTLQEFKSKIIIRKSELARMEVEISQKRSNLDKAQKEVDELTLTAPTRGLIVYEMNYRTEQKFKVGDTPWAGQSVITLPDLFEMESVTSVNEVDVSKVSVGLPVTVKLDAFQDTSFTGKISSVAKLGKKKSNESSIKTFDIIVDIEGQSEKLKPGMSTNNKIIIKEIPNTIFIPQEAVFEKENKHFVFIKNSRSFEEQFIEVGDKSEDYIIVKKGLKPGDIVALKNPYEEKDKNSKVESNGQLDLPSKG